MLSILFKVRITEEDDEYLMDTFKGYPLKFESDATDSSTKVTVYIGNDQIAKDKSDKLKLEGFKFVSKINKGEPILHESFILKGDVPSGEEASINAEEELHETSPREPSPMLEQHQETPVSSTQRIEMKPNVRAIMRESNTTPARDPPPPVPVDLRRYVTFDQLGEFSNNANDQLNPVLSNMMSRIEALTAAQLSVARMVNANSGNVQHIPVNNVTSRGSSAFTAKNELIANGIKCEKCNKTVKDVEPISKLILAVREHVMHHFDSENPLLKRYECRQCPAFKTNFVDDFEKHLKSHGTMTSLPERRKQLCVNLMTETHLKLISDLCNACFPEVFEKTPPALNSIHAIDTPMRAKVSIFPNLDRLYCTKYNIPYSCSNRSSQVIRID